MMQYFHQQGNLALASFYGQQAISEQALTNFNVATSRMNYAYNRQQALVELATILYRQNQYQQVYKLANFVNQSNRVNQTNSVNSANIANELSEQLITTPALTKLVIKSLMAEEKDAELYRLVNTLNNLPQSQSSGYAPLFSELRMFNLLNDKPNSANASCSASITLVGSRWESLTKWATFAKQLKHSELASVICVQQIQYVPDIAQNCVAEKGQAISCSELFWQQYTDVLASEYLAVMLDEGGANVHYGILYLDKEDDFTVFKHELNHLLGFVDEYELANSHTVCRLPNMALGYNIAIVNLDDINNNRLDLDQVKQLPWFAMLSTSLNSNEYLVSKPNETGEQIKQYLPINQALSESGVGMFVAETCSEETGHVALKPLPQLTIMRNHNTKFPKTYVDLLKQSPRKFNRPSFHYNIAYALYQQGNNEAAREFLKQSATYTSDQQTKAKILIGGY
ncbi:hypothetical protein [Colwellia sp. MEBiC06753]